MTRYHYAKAGRSYLCLEQSRRALLWHLVARARTLHLSHLGIRRGSRRLVGLRLLCKHLVRKGMWQGALELPVFGHICIPVHRGYKVFDFKRSTVFKVFRDDVEVETVRAEAERAREAAQLDFAPHFHGWNKAERWYEEDFFPGVLAAAKGPSTAAFLAEYQRDVAPQVEAMALLHEPIVKPFAEYAAEVASIVDDPRLAAPTLDPARVAQIRDYLATSLKGFESEPGHAHLVYSHGDFSLENLMLTEAGLKCIDWESGGPRSLIYDLLNYFFTELHYKRARTDMVQEVRAAVDDLCHRLETSSPTLAESLRAHESSYLRLYYLERTRTFLERELNDNMLDVALQSIAAFRTFDEHNLAA
jgi:hypothetical protein